MRWFNDLRLAKKLALSFAVLLALTAGLGLVSLHGVKRVNAAGAEVGGHWLPSVRQSLETGKAVAEYRNAEALLVLSTSSADMDGYQAEMDSHRDEVAQAGRRLGAELRTGDDSAAVKDFRTAWAAYQATSRDVVAAGRKGDAKVALAMLSGTSQEQYDKISAALGRVADAAEEGARAQMQLSAATYLLTSRSVVAALVACMLLGGALATLIGRRVADPVREIAERMRRLADGDLEHTVTISSRDELGALADSFRGIVAAQAGLAEAAGRLAAGDVSVEVVPRSEHDVLSRSFAEVQDTLRALVGEATTLVGAAKEGRLESRADAERFRGAYRDMMGGMNDMIAELSGPVTELHDLLTRVAGRDLSARMTGTYRGAFARLQESFDAAIANLDEAMAQVAASADQVASASNEIASGSGALAQGSSQQAASLEEISASLHELGSAAKQNAGSARQARGMAENARSGAAAGVASMQELSDAVGRIKASADKTARIVRTIDEIAFQTNLLALNAAVEAARAGEAGRGFAVVAEEVRALAQRSAQAARETGALIEESVGNADAGVVLNDAVLGRLRQINADVNSVGEVMVEISAASEQQDLGVGQINSGLSSMNAVTQQVAASAEESSSAAVELSSQSEGLRDLVGTFRLSDVEAPAAAAPARVPVRPPAATSTHAAESHVALNVVRESTPAPARRAPSRIAALHAPTQESTGIGASRVPTGAWPSGAESLIPLDGDGDDDATLREF